VGPRNLAQPRDYALEVLYEADGRGPKTRNLEEIGEIIQKRPASGIFYRAFSTIHNPQ
jgi:hypothetical protein